MANKVVKEKEYIAKDLTVLEGLDAVRLRPGMYIGTTGVNGLHHILWEIVDNAIDEAMGGYCKKIEVELLVDGSARVSDDGRGIPVDLHPKLKVPGVEVVFTKLHAGGKFNDSNYSYSGGLHGVGASVTNALSRYLEVDVFKNGSKYSMKFESVEDKSGKIRSGVVTKKLSEVKDKSRKSGSVVTFLPDNRVFAECDFNRKTVAKRLRELAFLNKGLNITFKDFREQSEDGTVYFKEYCYNGGLIDFIEYLNEGNSMLYPKPIYLSGEKDGVFCEFAILHNDSYNETIISYVNNIPTSEGGTHETGFKSGLTKVFNDYARKNGILKEKDANFMGEDFRVGMTAIMSVKMKNIQFEGQTKTKLGNPEAKSAVESIITSALPAFMEKKGTGATVEMIIKKAMSALKEREALKRAKDLARTKNSLDNANLVGKLASCTGRKAELNEIFIVEGDSAGGTAKQARDRSFQAILPLRGKPLNTEKKKLEQVLQNEEIRTIVSALGAGIGEDFNIESLKYHKVVILSDADQDGLHIRSILLTFFYRYMRELVLNGNVYIGKPPLYKVSNRNFEKYAYDEKELNKFTAEAGKGYAVQRYKGLGEMNVSQLWDTTLDPKARTLIRVAIDDVFEAERLVGILMGDNLEQRKIYINENCNLL